MNQMSFVPRVPRMPPPALPVRVSFSGDRGDFRRLVTAGALLELVTVGFYRFWLTTDIRRHLWAHTAIDGDAAEYTGRGGELLIGFLIASIVPTARFAQPIGGAILYPMLALCGLFVPLEALPPPIHAVARALPLTYAVSLLEGIWKGEAWSAHIGDVAALILVFAICTALSAKVFRWE